MNKLYKKKKEKKKTPPRDLCLLDFQAISEKKNILLPVQHFVYQKNEFLPFFPKSTFLKKFERIL